VEAIRRGARDRGFLGEGLLARVTEILQRHEITPVAAADELDPLGGLLLQLETMLDQLFAGLEFFHIGAEALAPGDFEVGFLLPRDAVDNELEKLGKEFAELDRRLGVFQELGTGTRTDLEVRSLSSSGFQVFLVALPGFALVMSKVLESLLTSYQKILDIRETHERLRKDDVPAERIQPLLDFANEKMALDIEALTGALIDEFGDRLPDAGRANELRLEITHSLNVLANRIDEGYSIEVPRRRASLRGRGRGPGRSYARGGRGSRNHRRAAASHAVPESHRSADSRTPGV
jgi:hypothetical protein